MFGFGRVDSRVEGLARFQSAPAAFSGQQFGEWRGQFVSDDFVVDDVDAGEERLVELLAGVVRGVAIELIGVGEQVEVGVDVRQPAGEVVFDGGEFRGELVALPSDLVESRLDLGNWQLAVGGEVEQVLFLDVELLDLGLKLLAEQALGVRLVRDGGFELAAHGLDELGAQADGLVVLLDGAFDARDVGVGRVADVLLDAAAEEVVVLLAVPAGGTLQDHALDHAVFETASAAPDGALQVVLVLDAPLTGLVAGVEQGLDGLEQLRLDDRVVPAVVRLALVLDLAEVVAVAEHALHLRDGDGCGWAVGGRPRGEAPIGELGRDVLEGVVPGGVELEGELDERGPLLVNGDGADLAPVDPFEGVLVADRSPSEGATVLGLLAHLVGDVGAVLARPVLVERGQDAVHELTDRGGVDGLRGGDESDTALLEVCHDDGVVGAVAREAGQLVDDDVVHVAVAADAFEHLLKGDALGHLRRGTPRLHVLGDDGQTELVGLALAGSPLRGDGDALGLVVGVDLPL